MDRNDETCIIPDDVCEYVFSYLNMEQIKIASVVCKLWNTVCHSRSIWKRVFLRDILFDESSLFGDGKTLDWRQLYKFCFTSPRVAKKLFKAQIASVGFVWQMGYYEDEEINTAVSQIVRKYLRAVVVEDIHSLLRMKDAISRYGLPCVCLEALQCFPAESLVNFALGGPYSCLGNAVNAIVCPPEFEYLRVPLFSQLIGGNVVVYGSDTAVSGAIEGHRFYIQPESEVRYVSRSQIFSRYSFVSVQKSMSCTLGSGPCAVAAHLTKRKFVKISNHDNSTNNINLTNNTNTMARSTTDITNNINNSTNTITENNKMPRMDHPPTVPSSSPSDTPTEYTDLLKLDISYVIDMFQVERVAETMRNMVIQRLGSKVAMVNREWGKEEITELREKLEQFKPTFVLGIREDIFSIKKNLDLEGSAFTTPEKLKEAIFELSPIGSIVRPKMVFVKQIEYTDMVKAALPKKFRNTMYCYLQNLPINMEPVLSDGRRNLQDLIDIDENFSDLSVGFYLKSTLLCDRLEEALEMITYGEIMKMRRKVVFCVKDGFVVERDGIIKVANAAREVPRCKISFRKRKAQDSA